MDSLEELDDGKDPVELDWAAGGGPAIEDGWLLAAAEEEDASETLELPAAVYADEVVQYLDESAAEGALEDEMTLDELEAAILDEVEL